MRTAREVGVFIRRGSEHLLLHRTRERYGHIVAGVVEDGETFIQAGLRELREESGLEVEALAHDLGEQGYEIPLDMRGAYVPGLTHITIHSFGIAVPPDWEPVLNEEHDAYRWCRPDEACALARWPETKEAIRRFDLISTE